MSINIKKYTKEQMARMVEEAQEKIAALEAEVTELHEQLAISNKAAIAASEEYQENTAKLRGRIAAHIDTISQMNGEAVNKANEIANLKADADALRNKLADTEAALGRANAYVSHYKSELRAARKEATDAQWAQIDEYRRADYAEAHPWRNLWAWVKRKLGCKA